MDFLRRLRKKEGSGKPYPTGGPALFFARIGTYFWKFLLLNGLFLIFSLPVLTIPAALTAVYRVIIQIINKERCFLWDDFWEEFRRNFKRSLLLALRLFPDLLILSLTLTNGIGNRQSFLGIALLSLSLFGMTWFLLKSTWAFVMNAMLDLKVTELLRNARILALTERRTTLVIILIYCITVVFLITVFPVSPWIFLLLFFSFKQYTVCTFLYDSILKRIVIPFEQNTSSFPPDKA